MKYGIVYLNLVIVGIILLSFNSSALHLNEFWGFESNSSEEIGTVNGSGACTYVNEAQNEVENYSVWLKAASGCYFFGNSYADQNNGMIFGMYIKPRQSTNPNPEHRFFAARESKDSSHFRFTMDDNVLELYDSNDVLLNNTFGLSVGTWYLIEAFLQKGASGNVTVFVDGSEVYTHLNVNVSGTPVSGVPSNSTAMEFFSAGAGANPGDVYVGSTYFYGNATSTDDFLGDYEVIMYQNRNQSSDSDAGGNLDAGTNWSDAGETPMGESLYARYTGSNEEGHVSSWTELDGEIAGPYGDDRIDGDSNIIGGSWIYRLKGSLTYTQKRCYGDVPYDSINTDSSTCNNVANTGVYTNYQVFSEDSSKVANTTEYMQFGFGGQALGALDVRLAEVWANILHVPSDSCNYTSGNWEVVCGDDCVINSNVEIDPGCNISISGEGSFHLNATNITGWYNSIVNGGCKYRQTGGAKFL